MLNDNPSLSSITNQLAIDESSPSNIPLEKKTPNDDLHSFLTDQQEMVSSFPILIPVIKSSVQQQSTSFRSFSPPFFALSNDQTGSRITQEVTVNRHGALSTFFPDKHPEPPQMITENTCELFKIDWTDPQVFAVTELIEDLGLSCNYKDIHLPKNENNQEVSDKRRVNVQVNHNYAPKAIEYVDAEIRVRTEVASIGGTFEFNYEPLTTPRDVKMILRCDIGMPSFQKYGKQLTNHTIVANNYDKTSHTYSCNLENKIPIKKICRYLVYAVDYISIAKI